MIPGDRPGLLLPDIFLEFFKGSDRLGASLKVGPEPVKNEGGIQDEGKHRR
jgi:hypothetical protein